MHPWGRKGRNVEGFHLLLPFDTFLEWFPNECRKTKIKVSTLTNHKKDKTLKLISKYKYSGH